MLIYIIKASKHQITIKPVSGILTHKNWIAKLNVNIVYVNIKYLISTDDVTNNLYRAWYLSRLICDFTAANCIRYKRIYPHTYSYHHIKIKEIWMISQCVLSKVTRVFTSWNHERNSGLGSQSLYSGQVN